MTGFSKGMGRWAGTAEVFSGDGRFLGNGADTRHVHPSDDGRVRIDVSFVGPFKHAGHYFIQDNADHRLYQGPANVGYAETLSDSVVEAHAYWPALGLSQRFFLTVLPDGNTQLSLALLSRGEHVLYVVVGQNDRVSDATFHPPALISGTSFDLASDPSAGRGALLLHRPGEWTGELTVLDGKRQRLSADRYTEALEVANHNTLNVKIEGGFVPTEQAFQLRTTGWHAWTLPNQPIAGSYSLSGGRALSGHLHHLGAGLRVWRREVVTHDGGRKAVLHVWYRGGERVGIQFGVLQFQAGS